MGRLLQNRRVQDPSLTDALFYAERAKKPNDPNIGRVWIEENAITRIGGLALIRRRLNHHEKAAEWFKTAYEQLYGGMAPAIDMAKVRVDTSIMAHDNGAVARLDGGRKLLELIVGVQHGGQRVPALLAKAATDRIINCVVFGCPAGDLAVPGPSGKPSGRAIEREVDLLLEALDQVAEINGYKMRGAA